MNKRISKPAGLLFLILELSLIPLAIELMQRQHISSLLPLEVITLSTTFGSIALCLLMSFSSMGEHDNHPQPTFLFQLMAFLCFLAPLTDLATHTLDHLYMPSLNLLVNTLYFLIGANIAYVILLYELLIIGVSDKPVLKMYRRIVSILAFLHNIATVLNIRFGYFFIITGTGVYQSSPTVWAAYLAPLLIVAAIIFIAIREMKPGRTRRTFLFFWTFGILASLLQFLWEELTVQYTGYTLSLIVIYMNIQSELDTPIQEANRHEHSNKYR